MLIAILLVGGGWWALLYRGGGETERIFCCAAAVLGRQVLGRTKALGKVDVSDNGRTEGSEVLVEPAGPTPFMEAKVAATANAVEWAIGGEAWNKFKAVNEVVDDGGEVDVVLETEDAEEDDRDEVEGAATTVVVDDEDDDAGTACNPNGETAIGGGGITVRPCAADVAVVVEDIVVACCNCCCSCNAGFGDASVKLVALSNDFFDKSCTSLSKFLLRLRESSILIIAPGTELTTEVRGCEWAAGGVVSVTSSSSSSTSSSSNSSSLSCIRRMRPLVRSGSTTVFSQS